ncbi:MAG: hypothetical protein ACRDO1_13440 [Nocardioidaceae bacterium]
MSRPAVVGIANAAVALALAPAAGLVAVGDDQAVPVTVAVVGDVSARTPAASALVDEVNTDSQVGLVLQAGRLDGSEAVLDRTATLYDRFDDPVALMPGGGSRVRRLLFADVGWTAGAARRVTTQGHQNEHAEHLRFLRSDVVFATVCPDDEGAALDWVDEGFAEAGMRDASGVVITMPTAPDASAVGDRIVGQARHFGLPVLLIHGGRGLSESEQGYAGVPNLTRLQTFGGTAERWVELRIEPHSREVFSWSSRTVG